MCRKAREGKKRERIRHLVRHRLSDSAGASTSIASLKPLRRRSFEAGLPGRNRTCDPQLRRLLLYPTELRGEEEGGLVGARGFEPPTPCSQSRCATRLRYTPTANALRNRRGPSRNSVAAQTACA